MENDGHVDSMLALQATRSEHHCITYKFCRHNLVIFMAIEALPMQLIAQAHPRPFTKQQLEVFCGQSHGNWPRAKSCLSLNNPLVGSRDYVIFASLSLNVNPKKFLTNHRARKSDCRIAPNTPIFREEISLLSQENRCVRCNYLLNCVFVKIRFRDLLPTAWRCYPFATPFMTSQSALWRPYCIMTSHSKVRLWDFQTRIRHLPSGLGRKSWNGFVRSVLSIKPQTSVSD